MRQKPDTTPLSDRSFTVRRSPTPISRKNNGMSHNLTMVFILVIGVAFIAFVILNDSNQRK